MILRVIASISVLFLLGCTPAIRFSLYNNTGHVVRVSECGQEVEVIPKESELVAICDTLVLEFDGDIRFYEDFTPPPEQHNDLRAFLDSSARFIVFRSQINSDGSIYLVRKDEVYPLDGKISQPNGYPVQARLVETN